MDRKSYADVEFFTAMSLSFYGFLRFSELINLEFSDIKIEPDGIVLNIKRSKNDPLSNGTMCFISKGDQPHNPFVWCELFFFFK